MKFTFRQLEYFVAAGETGSVTLASERANISQPSISSAISHLEQEFGVQLFLRHHAQGLSLTPAGRTLLREAKLLIGQASGLYSAISSEGPVRGTLSVGCLVTLAPMVMPEVAHSFMESFPNVEIFQRDDDQEGLLRGLRRAEFDIVITYDLQMGEDISFVPLVSLPPHVVFGSSDELHDRQSVELHELAARPMILLDLPISRDYFLSLFAEQHIEPRIWWRSPYQEVVRTMVANGYGYALFNARPLADVALDGRRLHRVKLSGNHRPATLGMATLGALKKSQLVEAFETHCHKLISSSYVPGMASSL